MRDDLGLSFTDEELESYPFIEPETVPEVVAYMKERRASLGGYCPGLEAQKVISPLQAKKAMLLSTRGQRARCKFRPPWLSFVFFVA